MGQAADQFQRVAGNGMKATPQYQLEISTSAEMYLPMKLSRETADHAVIARFIVDGEPVSKARARFTKYGSTVHAYTPQKTLDAEAIVAARFREATGPIEVSKEHTYGVMAVFRNGTRQRRDVDNMIKLLLDGLNGVAWGDDNQVVEVSGRKEFVGKGKANTEVVVYRIGVVSNPTRPCDVCRKPYRTYESVPNKLHCSDDCRLAARRLARRKICEHCGVSWDPGFPSDARYCSRECRNESSRIELNCSYCDVVFSRVRSFVRKKNYCSTDCSVAAAKLRVGPRKGTCQSCGGPVSRKEYIQCVACHRSLETGSYGVRRADLKIGALESVGSKAGDSIPYVTRESRVKK